MLIQQMYNCCLKRKNFFRTSHEVMILNTIYFKKLLDYAFKGVFFSITLKGYVIIITT